MLADERIAEILDQAADDIEANGWQRLHCAQYSRPYLYGGPGAMSALGAIQNVITGSPSRWDTPHDDPRIAEIDKVMACLDQRYVRLNPGGWFIHHAEPFVAWHDETPHRSLQPLRTQGEIVAFLRATAAELRTPAAGELRATHPGDETRDGDGTGDGRGAELVCPECGEPARAVPPVRVPLGLPAQEFSHTDGEPLCVTFDTADRVCEPCTPVTRDAWEREN